MTTPFLRPMYDSFDVNWMTKGLQNESNITDGLVGDGRRWGRGGWC